MRSVTVGNTNTAGRAAAYCPKCGAMGERVDGADGSVRYECDAESCDHSWQLTGRPQPTETATRV